MPEPVPLDAEALLRPGAVMLVGASHDTSKPGGAILRKLASADRSFALHAVNPRPIEVAGAQWSASIAAVPEPCELAVVALAAALVPDTIAALAAKGVRVAVVLSAGLGADSKLGQLTLAAARASGIRIVGPNCLGLIVPGVGLDAAFAADDARPGKLAFLSQSGALVTAVLDWADSRGIGFSALVSVGDMLDVGLDELLALFGEDGDTSAILIYLEGLRDARPLLRALRAVTPRKPVIVLKAGRTREGVRAARSHTGALAGSYDVYCAALRQAGAVMVESLEELFDAAAVLARSAPLAGESLAIVTNGGGAGILAVDAMDGLPGRLAELSAETIVRLDGALPATWSRGNPVDIIGDAGVERYRAAVSQVAADPGVDALLVMNCPTAVVDSAAIAGTLAQDLRDCGKPVLACWLGDGNARRARTAFAAGGIALFETPGEAIRGYSYLVQAARAARQVRPAGGEPSQALLAEARALVAAVRADGRLTLSELEAKALLALFGVPVVPTAEAATPAEVAAACARLPAPYAVKIVSPDLTHKSDIGGVALGLSDAPAAQAAAEAMFARIRTARPEARLQGFSVQPMIRRKQAHELFAGVATDPAFGPVLMVGAGGTAVEVLADRAIRLPPLDRQEAEAMLSETRISQLLSGYRDVAPTRREAVVEVLLALSGLVRLLPEIAELDVNPLLADAEGVIALDARVILSSQDPPLRRPG